MIKNRYLPTNTSATSAQNGFTLIELSIVLVIIGLIIGGVLVGRDLIRAAEVRGTVAQKEKFDASINAFKLKYGALPGDMLPTTASALGFFQLSNTCGGTCTTYSFNNKKIDYSDGTGGTVSEFWAVWRHLSDARMIDGKYGSKTGNSMNVYGELNSYPTGWERDNEPVSKFSGIFWNFVTPDVSVALATIVMLPWNAAYQLEDPISGVLTPQIIQAMDTKMDDGVPNTGNVRERAGANGNWASTAQEWRCTYGGADQWAADTKYNVDPATGGGLAACSAIFKAGF